MIKLTYIFLGLVLYISFSTSAYAHFTQENENVSVLFHINPDDSPVANHRDSSLYFRVSDKHGMFTGDLCNCFVSISQNGRQLHKERIFDEAVKDRTSTIVPYIFSKKGIYQIYITASPKNKDDFKPFSFVFDLRVDKDQNSTTTSIIDDSTTLITVLVITFTSLFIIIILILRYVNKRKEVIR